jgi:hypothetical protein
MKTEMILLGSQLRDIFIVSEIVSNIEDFELMEMSSEEYGDGYYTSTLLKMTERFGYFVNERGLKKRPRIDVFPRVNSRYGYINDDDLGDYPVSISLVWINEIDTLLPKLLADPELKLELLKTWPSG